MHSCQSLKRQPQIETVGVEERYEYVVKKTAYIRMTLWRFQKYLEEKIKPSR